MNELEGMLRTLGGELDWPATPDLAAAVGARIRREPRRAGRRLPIARIRRPLAVALAALLVAGGGAYGAIPGFRDVVKDFLGVKSVEVQRVPGPPRLPPGAGRDLGLGRRVTLARARDLLGFRPLVPGFRAPGQVYVSDRPVGGQLGLVYVRAGAPRLLVTEFRGALPGEYVRKSLGPGTRLERLRIRGEPAVWLAGAPHQFVYEDARGRIDTESTRLAGNTLLWVHRGLVVRIEGARSRAEALTVALSVP